MNIDPKKFYDEFYLKLFRDFLAGNPRTESAIKFACEELRKRNAARVLDLGFGLGWSSYEYSRSLSSQAKVTGIDLSSKLTDIASLVFGDGDNVSYFCQDLCDPGWLKICGRYDACVMLDVYEHIPRSSRKVFHQALAAILGGDATVILTCPSPMHQSYLRQYHPEGLQPVDEDVTFDDIREMASDIGGVVTHLSYSSIWSTNDYFHLVVTLGDLRYAPISERYTHQLIGRRERERRLKKSNDIVGRELIDSLIRRRSISDILKRVASRSVRSLSK